MFPFSSWNSEDRKKLWAWMESYEKKTGASCWRFRTTRNLSNGRMFELTNVHRRPAERASTRQQRQRWEPLQEIIQTKGTSESHPLIATADEFLDMGIAGWEYGNLTLEDSPLTKAMMPTNYLREASKRGLEQQGKLGVNPFKFGVVGSSDIHNSLSFMEEDNYFGKMVIQEPSPSAGSTRRRSVPGTRSWAPSARVTPGTTTRGLPPPSGRPRTRARRCGTRCNARRSTAPPARG